MISKLFHHSLNLFPKQILTLRLYPGLFDMFLHLMVLPIVYDDTFCCNRRPEFIKTDSRVYFPIKRLNKTLIILITRVLCFSFHCSDFYKILKYLYTVVIKYIYTIVLEISLKIRVGLKQRFILMLKNTTRVEIDIQVITVAIQRDPRTSLW